MISLAATLPFTVLALHVPSLFVRIFGLGKPALQYLERLASHDWVLRMTSELRRRLYETVEGMTSAVRGRTSIGDALGLLTEDIGRVQDLYLRTVLPMASAWLLYVVVIVALGLFSIPVACALGLLLAVVLFVAPLASVCVNGARIVRAKTVRAALYDDLVDNVLGVADWVRRALLTITSEGSSSSRRASTASTREVRRYNRLRDAFLQVAFGLCAVLLLAGRARLRLGPRAARASSGALGGVGSQNAPAYAANWVAAFVLCFFPLIESFSPVPTAALGLVTHGASIKRLNDFGAPGALFPKAAPPTFRRRRSSGPANPATCRLSAFPSPTTKGAPPSSGSESQRAVRAASRGARSKRRGEVDACGVGARRARSLCGFGPRRWRRGVRVGGFDLPFGGGHPSKAASVQPDAARQSSHRAS